MIRLAVRCEEDQAGVVLAALADLAPNGVEEDRGDGWVEYAIYAAAGELPDLGDVRAAAGGRLVDVSATRVPEDWADRWQDFHKPLLVAGRIWVRPSWAPARVDTLDVVVDPGRAFGTGAHPTTRLCLELLAGAARGPAPGALTDLGTGSGVLAIAAARLGFAPVRGYDHEPAALEAAAANAAANGVEVGLVRLNLREGLPPLAPTVVANLTAPLLREVASRIAAAEARPRLVICSGLLHEEADAVETAFAAAGLGEAGRRADGDWAALLCCPP